MSRRSKRPPAATMVPPRQTMAPTHDAHTRDVLPFMATDKRGAPAPPSTVGLPFVPPVPKAMEGAIAITAAPELGAAALPTTQGTPDKPTGVLETMNAAAVATASSIDPATAPRATPPVRIRRQSTSASLLRLLWFDPAVPRWIRNDAEWSRLLARASPPHAADPPQPADDAQHDAERERCDVLTVLATGPTTPAHALVKAVEASMGAHGEFWPPRVAMAGELALRFDPRERAKALVAATAPLVTHDAPLSASLAAARRLLDDTALEGADGIAEALIAHVHDILGKAKRGVTSAYIDNAVQRALIVQRRYLGISMNGARWICSKIFTNAEDSPVPVVLPEALGPLLPMLERFPVRMVADVELSQDPAEKAPLLLRVVALARVVPRSSLHQ